MKKGHTKPCPCCRKPAIRHGQFRGEGRWETICPHCHTLLVIEIGMETVIIIKENKNGLAPREKKE